MTTKHAVIFGGAYLGAGLLTAAYTVYLGANGRPHFTGFSAADPVLGLLETVFVWPWALFVNVTAS